MKKRIMNLFWGIVLIALGVVFLLREMNIIYFQDISNTLWALIFATLSAFFLITYFLSDKKTWGLLFPVTVLAGIALTIGLDDTRMGRILGGAPILLAVAVPFLVAFFEDRETRRWALIPAWAMTVLTMVVLFERFLNGNLIGALVLYSIALPFLLVYIMDHKRNWALIPCLALMVVGTIPLLGMFVFGAYFDIAVVVLMAVPFLAVYLWSKKNWWALIPAGVFTSIALSFILSERLRIPFPSELFLAGLGLTFGILWLMREQYSTDWAKFPALALFGVAVLVLFATNSSDLVGPIVLLVTGVVLLLGSIYDRSRKLAASDQSEGK